MALPRWKHSKARTRKRRSHLALAVAQIQPCPQCKKPRRSHTVCPNCGHYAGREVISTD